MKRKQLEHLVDQFVNFRGKFVGFGKSKKYHMNKQIYRLFKDVYINETIYVDHMWISDCRRMRRLDIRCGAVVEFEGKVVLYYGIENGYNIRGHKRNIRVVKNGKRENLEEYLMRG